MDYAKYQTEHRGKKWKMPRWILQGCVFVGILFACFLAWRDERMARENATADNQYKQQRIDRIADYNKTHPATPPVTVTSNNQSGGITAQTVNVGPKQRHLTASQRTILVSELRKIPPREITISFAQSGADPMIYGRELKEAFVAGGWSLTPGISFVPETSSRGTFMRIKDASNMPKGAAPLINALIVSGIWTSATGRGMLDDSLKLDDLGLFVALPEE